MSEKPKRPKVSIVGDSAHTYLHQLELWVDEMRVKPLGINDRHQEEIMAVPRSLCLEMERKAAAFDEILVLAHQQAGAIEELRRRGR